MNVARFAGGPWGGQFAVPAQWPPPLEIALYDGQPLGTYRRTSLSAFPEEPAAPLARAAEYTWEPAS